MARLDQHINTPEKQPAERLGVDPAPAIRARLATGIFLGIASLVIIVGVPLFLYFFVGSRWPSRGPTMRDWETLHLKSETELFLGAVSALGWIIWAIFTVAVLHAVIVTAVDTIRYGITAETWRDAANPARWMAGLLIGAIAALWPAAAHAQAAEPVEQTTAGRALTDDELAQTTASNHAPSAAFRAAATTRSHQPAAPVGNDTPAGPVPDAAAANTEVQDEGRYVVRRGDTLWSIAGDYLGDPMRYMEIYHANQGRTFTDGGTLTDPSRINEGWELAIPAAAAADSDSAATGGQTTHIVGANDSLWSLAAHYLGDGNRWGEIYQANQGRTFTDGRTLTDSDLIIDGWELLIPAQDTDTDEGATSPEPEPSADDAELEGEGEVVAPTGEQSPPAETTAPPPPEDQSTAAETDAPTPASGHSGLDLAVPFGVWIAAGTCLAATTVVAIAARLRKRRPPHTPSTPSLGPDQALSGRLSDLEAVIEAENRRLAQLDTEPELELDGQAAPAGVDAEAQPISLGNLAPNGLGLLGPGQRAAARAAVVAAAAAGQHVYVTAAAELGLELGDHNESTVQVTDTLQEALTNAGKEGPAVVVCAESDFGEDNRTVFAHFAERDECVALVLGDWEPSAVTLAGDGTVQTAAGQATELTDAVLHIADPATSSTILTGLAEADATPEDDQDEPEELLEATAEPDGAPTASEGVSESDRAVRLRLCLFGSPDVYLGDKPVPLKKGRRARTFLAVLALADGPVGRDEVFEAVVGDATDYNKARSNLNTTGTETRKNLRQATGLTDVDFYTYNPKAQTYRLESDYFTTDVADFDAAEQAAALTTDPAERARHLEAALTVYADDLVPEIDTDQVNELRDQYRAAAHRACRTLADYYTEQGDAVRAERYAAKATSLGGKARPAIKA